jgi:hypothetical protein
LAREVNSCWLSLVFSPMPVILPHDPSDFGMGIL